MTIVSECVSLTFKHTTKMHVAITFKTAIKNNVHICRYGGRDSSVGIVIIVTEELLFDSQQQQKAFLFSSSRSDLLAHSTS